MADAKKEAKRSTTKQDKLEDPTPKSKAAPETWLKASMLVPCNNAKQRAIAVEFGGKLLETFGGYTSHGTCLGFWQDGADLHQDTNLPLELCLPEGRLPELKEMLVKLKLEMCEKTMYLDYHPVAMELL